jgi:DNA-binding PadR family transcriptional regulator
MPILHAPNNKALLEQYTKRLVSSFLDVIILNHFQKENFSGYDVTMLVCDRFTVPISHGTIYSTIYTMERNGLLKSSHYGGKTIYKTTELGLQLSNLVTTSKEIASFLESLTKKY